MMPMIRVRGYVHQVCRRPISRSIAHASAILLWATGSARAFSPNELPQVGYHPSGPVYYGEVYFANALWMEDRNWRVKKPKPGGQAWEHIFESPAAGQVDSLGNPLYVEPGTTLIAHPGQNGNDPAMFRGRVVLEWNGEADIRITNGTFLPADAQGIPAGQPRSNGPATGLLLDGVRVYDMGQGLPNGLQVEVFAITANSTMKPRNIRAWLAHPSTGNTLRGETWHPNLLARLNDRNWGYIRFMDWGYTNGSPQKDWSDRRRPQHIFQVGVIHPRDPTEGAIWYRDSQGNPVYFSGNRLTGVAYEHMVALCNATNKHLWINVPHLATDDYVRKLAQLIRFGADANGNPYTSVVSNPVYPPLKSTLKVYVEYSNEIWSSGDGFAQGNWAAKRAAELNITKEAFNARRFCDVWRIFQEVFGSNDRLVKVAAVFTGSEYHTRPFLDEIKRYGATLNPPQEPDIISPTTYFGNGIQDWAHNKATQQAGTTDEWFYTNQDWDHDNNPATPPRKVSKPADDPYWTSQAFQRHLNEAFDEWTHRQLSGAAVQGGGPDNTGSGGGFDYWLREMAQTTFSAPKPIVAYEGGPSLYTDYMDGGDPRDDGVTRFIVEMNRHARIKEVYRTHLHMAKAKGLWAHMMFVDASGWGKYGQWGHLERLSQPPTESPKYVFILEWIDQETNGLRHIDQPLNEVPTFDAPAALPDAFVGAAYNQTITTSGGNGARTVRIIARTLRPGLSASVSGTSIIISGTPSAVGSSFIFAQVKDGDGDPAWRTFSVRSVSRSTDPAVTIDFENQTVTGGDPVTEPLDISGYRFTSFGNAGLCIQGTDPGWNGEWASKVLMGRYWGTRQRLQRVDGRPFDLYELDIAAHQAQSVRITGFAPGGARKEKIVNVPLQKKPMTRVTLDWVTIEKVEFEWFENPNANGGNRNGALDNIKINTTSGGSSQLRNPDNPPNTVNGLEYSYYEGDWNALPNFNQLTPVKSGTATNFGLSLRNRDDQFGFVFTGYVDVAVDGEYTFFTNSDDGSRLYIGTTLVVDNDGLHPPVERSGRIGLKAGKHAIRVEFFEKTGGEVLEVRYSGPNLPKQLIPNSALYRISASGNGLKAEYYDNADFTNLKLTRTDATVNFNWGSGSPHSSIGSDTFSVRWTGKVKPRYSETYTFFTRTDDGVKLWVNGQLLINKWVNQPPTEHSGVIALTANQLYDIRIDYYENTGGAVAELRWSSPSQSKEIIPQSCLYSNP